MVSKNRGERPGLFHRVNDADAYRGRQRGGGGRGIIDQNNAFCACKSLLLKQDLGAHVLCPKE